MTHAHGKLEERRQSQLGLRLLLGSGPCAIPLGRIHQLAVMAAGAGVGAGAGEGEGEGAGNEKEIVREKDGEREREKETIL